jgi:hypothetical protein
MATIICYLLTYFEDILASTPLGDRRGVVYGNFTKYLGFRFEDRMWEGYAYQETMMIIHRRK